MEEFDFTDVSDNIEQTTEDEEDIYEEGEADIVIPKHPIKATKKATKNGTKRKVEAALTVDWGKYMDKSPTLAQIHRMVTHLSSTNSTKQKQELLAQYPHCAKILLYVNQPYWKYGVTPENVESNKNKIDFKSVGGPNKDIFELLDLIKSGKVTGNKRIAHVLWFIYNNNSYKDLIYSIINKNLKIRCNTLSINKVFPKLIPVFAVALANKYDEKTSKKVDFKNGEWFCSRKFDGVRTVIIIDDNGTITFFSREGNEFVTLELARRKLLPLKLKSVVIDCEACIVEEDGSENFTKIVSEIKKESGYIKNPKMYIFDMITLDEFHEGKGTMTFKYRQEQLRKILGKKCEPMLEIAAQTLIKEEKQLDMLNKNAIQNGWEGLMLRYGDSVHEGKRTNNLLKVKMMEREEFKCIRIESGSMRVIDKDTGKEKEETLMTNAIIALDSKGNTVSVGSGFTLDDRRNFYANKSLIIGKTISVQFQERTQDKNGKPSLRFPTYKGLYGVKRDI